MTAADPAPSPAVSAPRALVFGGSGQIGERLLTRLLSRGWQVTAWSRQPRATRTGLIWRQADLAMPAAAGETFEAIFSCGPLDHFARWYAENPVVAARIVAFGSTSVEVKEHSSDPAERDVAQRLAIAEQALFSAAQARGCAATVLRPTLVYGAGRDKTLTQIAGLAQRTGAFLLPANATGLRQPVHVDDLANAALAVLGQVATQQRSYAVGGGEVLAYTQMVERVLAALPRPARLYQVPPSLFGLALTAAQRLGRLRGMNAAALQRMRDDLVFDLEPARRDFGYAPRAFRPLPEELGIGD
ncbi:NAD-dependent epimerase/dehydratase family protein [Xanthomonas melonis]|uniref:NAD-dependent epimerase/dehydratase family protein n=1 Tax=Xanthomonas melonis TaxID=56456 RepID=A0ABS8NRK7_9XANT|nr:NAD-dependent epimerase/dehydratase family protein [Xanthomonas melonis]MCD0244882.1 NAD-dependent epimerase/dehydratase family protein [Xanthomonas melonis]MCD0257236.1 NAD-dependent epimerase/dehydratase family protein [Xanthomonas melonis]MCD0265506.1 NAD-dependent epimerase/dehydratase family protein [Xanthomonas melonis]